jgi:hypothetical protein
LQREIRQALDIWQEKLEDDIYVIPARLEECNVHGDLENFQWVDLYEDDGWGRLLQAIQKGVDQEQSKGNVADNPERRALVVNTLMGEDSTAGKNDSARIYSILTRHDLGACSTNSLAPCIECKSRHEFSDYLAAAINEWKMGDHLIFYFSGRSCFVRNQYCFIFGENSKDTLPIRNIINDLQVSGVTSADLPYGR